MSNFTPDWPSFGRAPGTGSKPTSTDVVAKVGLVLEDVETGWVGAITRIEKISGMHTVELEDRHGARRSFPVGPGFWVDGKPVRLVTGSAAAISDTLAVKRSTTTSRTASGSLAVPGAAARTARASRILVEGLHDAELIEKIWGDDLRLEGVVVEPLHGVDDLADAVARMSPSPQRRLGILVDHLVAGTKEWHQAASLARLGQQQEHVLVVGHPYIDIWQAVRPERLGLTAWPHVPKGQDFKRGLLAALGWPRDTSADVAQGWRRILSSVRSYTDVQPELSGPVEHLIDFVTAAPGDD